MPDDHNVQFQFGGISVRKIIRIKIKDCEAIKKDERLRKFAGRVVIAVPMLGRRGKCFEFTANFSSGFKGDVREKHTISAGLVEILTPLK